MSRQFDPDRAIADEVQVREVLFLSGGLGQSMEPGGSKDMRSKGRESAASLCGGMC
jgi:hypothetical protein